MGGVGHGRTPKERISLALFTLNFLILDDGSCQCSHGSRYAMAATAGIALGHTVQMANTLNALASNVATSLDTQAAVSAQLKGGLQRIDLVQEQLDTLWQIAQLGCQWKYSGLCVTAVQYENFTCAANLSRVLSKYLLGNWSKNFDTLMEDLRVSITMVNSTRVNPEIAEGLASWFSMAWNHLKEWAGMGALFALLCLIFVICLWCLCKMRIAQQRQAAMVVQAFNAIEAGQSPQAWLTVIQDL